MKTCSDCGETKPKTEFHREKKNLSALRNQCKMCVSAYYKAYRTRNKDKIDGRMKVYREQNKEKINALTKKYYWDHRDEMLRADKAYRKTPRGRLRDYRTSSKQRNILFLLTEEEFESFWKKPCEYCGAEIETIGLDRVDNDGPYHIDNVVSCCMPCNSSKKTRSLEEWRSYE